VRLLADPGVTIRTICQECHVTDDVVRSVKARENIPIALQKKSILSSITHGLRLASERVIEVMPTASPRDALIGVGILGEKMQLLSGDATARVEIAPAINFHEELRRLKREVLDKFEAMKNAQAIEIGVEGEFHGQKALTDTAEGQPGEQGIEGAFSEPAMLQEATI
jgi:hypothetical protein